MFKPYELENQLSRLRGNIKLVGERWIVTPFQSPYGNLLTFEISYYDASRRVIVVKDFESARQFSRWPKDNKDNPNFKLLESLSEKYGLRIDLDGGSLVLTTSLDVLADRLTDLIKVSIVMLETIYLRNRGVIK